MPVEDQAGAAFASHVVPEPNSGCWLWSGAMSGSGYGNFKSGGRQILAHRYAYGIWVGEIPGGQIIRHKCDTRLCVNPDHLCSGTYGENKEDMMSRGRGNFVRGSRHGMATINEELARAIFLDADKNMRIARKFGVSLGVVYHIKARNTWRHATDT